MTLLEYLKGKEETIPAFAARLGEYETTIRKIVYRQRQPSLPLAVKIADATDGQVAVADMIVEAA